MNTGGRQSVARDRTLRQRSEPRAHDGSRAQRGHLDDVALLGYLQRTVGNQAVNRLIQRYGPQPAGWFNRLSAPLHAPPLATESRSLRSAAPRPLPALCPLPDRDRHPDAVDETDDAENGSDERIERKASEGATQSPPDRPDDHLPSNTSAVSPPGRALGPEAASVAGGLVQRCNGQVHAGCACEDESPELSSVGGLLQPAAEAGLAGGPLDPALAERIEASRGAGVPLDDGTRADLERAFGTSFGDVRLHRDAEADALNRSISARAFTTGSDIFLRRDVEPPASLAGRRLLAHELTHVVQQRSLSTPGPMTVGPANDRYEREAEAVADQVVPGRGRAPGDAETSRAPVGTAAPDVVTSASVQRQSDPSEDGLQAPFWSDDQRLQAAYRNAPPLRQGETGAAVQKLQEALVRQGFAMPGSTKPDGTLDGVWGQETTATVRAFQQEAGVRPVGGWEAGHKTLGALDARLQGDQPVPPKPEPTQVKEGVDVEEIPVLAAPGGGGTGPLLAFAVDAKEAPPAAPAPAGPQALEVPYQGSVQQSVYAVARWLSPNDDRPAAAAAARLVADPETTYSVDGKGTTADQYDAYARKKGVVRLEPGAVAFLCQQLGATRGQLEAAVDSEKKFGGLLNTANKWQFFGTPDTPLDPRGTAAESRRGRVKRTRLTGNDKLLENPQVAQLYVAALDKYARPTIDPNRIHEMAKDGLDATELQTIIAGDMRRRLITDFFTQGVAEYRQAGGSDVGGEFFLLEDTLLTQLTWGNPTAVKNELKIGKGLPEQQMGLVFRPDGTLYYDSHGAPLPSFAGGGFRDPGFKGSAKDPGLINLDLIHDEVIKGFFKLLHDRYKTPAMIVAKGAEAYWDNNEEVNARVRQKLPAEVLEHMADAVKILAGFLIWRAAAMAFMRSNIPVLQAVGAGMEIMAEAAGYVLEIEFLGSLEATLVSAGYELSRVTPKEAHGSYDAASMYHLEQAAGIIRPVIADVVIQLILAGVAEGLTRKKAAEAAKAKLEAITRNGERARIECTFCHLVQEAAEFSKDIGKDYYESTRKARGAKQGAILTDPKYPTVELHPDGNMYGEHGQLVKFIKDASLSKSGKVGIEVESHHLMEDHQMEAFGVPRDQGRCVALEKGDHQTFSAWMRGILNRKTIVDIDELYDLHREMYQDNGHPEYVEQIQIFLRQWKNVIRSRYESGKVPGSRRADFAERKARVLRFLDSL